MLTMSSYCTDDNSGSFCKNATMLQIVSSSWVVPHAGIALILRPCLITQNASFGSTRTCERFGGCGYSPGRSSESFMPGCRWQPVHIAAYWPAPFSTNCGSSRSGTVMFFERTRIERSRTASINAKTGRV